MSANNKNDPKASEARAVNSYAVTCPTSNSIPPPRRVGILGHARSENLSMTAALERLLEIEVNATEERRPSLKLRLACPIPRRSRTSTTTPPSPTSTRNSSATSPHCGFLDGSGDHRHQNLLNGGVRVPGGR